MFARGSILQFAAVMLSIIGLSMVFVGCGGSASQPSDPETSAEVSADGAPEPSAEFLNPSDRLIVKFGREASVAEREAAGAVVAESLRARAAADFAAQCTTLSIKAIEEIAHSTKGRDPGGVCPAALEGLAKPLSKSKEARKNTLSGPIAAMRVKGNIAHALFHGNDGKDYAIPLEKENGVWKVGSIVTVEL